MSLKKIIFGAGFLGVAGTVILVGTTSSTFYSKKCWYDKNGKFWDEIEEIISRNKDNSKLDDKNIEELKELIKKHCKTDFPSLQKEFDERFYNNHFDSLLLREVAEKISNTKIKN